MTDRDRKVRGQRITQSRDEKRADGPVTNQQATDRPDGTVTDSSGGQSKRANPESKSTSASEFGDAHTPKEFVETEAVAAVRDRVQRWLRADRPVHLVGPTGCGKTALAMQVARGRDRSVVFVNGDEQLTTADLVGEYGEVERESVRDRYVHNVMKSKDVVRDRWVDNPLTVAVREGATLVYNEFSRSKPAANNVLLSVFEEGVLELPGKRGEGRYVEVHPQFRAILTSNPVEYAGVHTPQDALLDRLIGIHMDFYDRETETAIVAAQVPDAPREVVDHIVGAVRRVREDDAVEATIGTRAMIMATEGAVAAGQEGSAGVDGTLDVDAVDEDLLASVVIDAVSSKVPDRDGIRRVRKAVSTAVARDD